MVGVARGDERRYNTLNTFPKSSEPITIKSRIAEILFKK